MKRFLIISAFLILACLPCFAQQDRTMLSVVSPDSLNVLLKNYLEQTTGKRFEDPTIPRFLICDRNDVFVFGVGGYVGSNLIYDYQGNDSPGFKPMNPSQTQYDNDVLNLDMTTSRFFFKVLGNTKRGIAEAYIEAGFSGASNTLALKKAYVNVLGFRVGLSNTAFADNQPIPVICANGAISYNGRAVPMIAYSYLYKSGLRVQGGFEFPQATTVYTSSEQLGERHVVTVEMPMPDFVLSSYYDKGPLHLYAGGYLRIMQFYDRYGSQEFVNTPGYAFQVSGNYHFGSSGSFSQKIYLQGQYEYMMADCFGNLTDKGLAAIMPNRIGWTAYDFTRGYGAQLGYSMLFGANSINLQGSMNKVFGHENCGFPDLYHWGFTSTANYMRKFWKYGTIGGELVFGRQRTIGGTSLSDFRIVSLLRYDF